MRCYVCGKSVTQSFYGYGVCSLECALRRAIKVPPPSFEEWLKKEGLYESFTKFPMKHAKAEQKKIDDERERKRNDLYDEDEWDRVSNILSGM